MAAVFSLMDVSEPLSCLLDFCDASGFLADLTKQQKKSYQRWV